MCPVPEPTPVSTIDFRDLAESDEGVPALRASDIRAARVRSMSDNVEVVAMWVAMLWLPAGVFRVVSNFELDAPARVAFLGGTVALIVGLLSFVVSRRRRSRNKPLPRLAAFAARNGFVYEPEAHALSLPGRIFRNKHSARLSVTHSVSDSSGEFQIANFDADGRNAVGFLAVKLDVALPHLFLASRPRAGSAVSPFAQGLMGEQRVDLEGDFPSTFTLFVPRGYDTDVRYLLTPDLMALLVDEAGGYSLEIVDDWFFVYSWHPLDDDVRVIRRLFDIMDVVGGRIDRRGTRYRDHRASTPGAIARGGRRLRKVLSAGEQVAGLLSFFAIISGLVLACWT